MVCTAEVVQATFFDDASLLQQVDAVDDVSDKVWTLLDEKDCEAISAELLQSFDELLDENRREAGGHLINRQYPRRGLQCPTDGEHLLFAARQASSEL